VARDVGVAQPYVFSLFATKLELFLAAVERSFELVSATFRSAAEAYDAGDGPPGCADTIEAMGRAYQQLLERDRDILMLQHQAFAACDDEAVRVVVRRLIADLIALVHGLSGADEDGIDGFMRYGMWLNVAAALGIHAHKGLLAWAVQASPRPDA
jgi:AcrR family transcriptional regulator